MNSMKGLVIPLLLTVCVSLLAETRRIDNETLYIEALQLAAKGQFFESKDLLQQALKKNPFHIASRRAMELLRDMEEGRVFPEAVRLIVSGMETDMGYDRKNALEFYRKTLEMVPDYYFLQHNLGSSLLEAGQTEKAVEELQKSLKLKEDYPYTHNNLGLAFHRLGRFKEAISSYQRAITIFPQYHKAYNNLAVTYFALGMEKEGHDQLKKALEINADYTLAFQNMSPLEENENTSSKEDPARSAATTAAPPLPTQKLLETLETGLVFDRKMAQAELSRRKDPTTVTSLVRMLASPSTLVRAAATEILGDMQAHEALLPLAKLVNDPEWTVRFAAVKALGALADPAAFFALLAALQDPDYHVREDAVCAAARLNNPEAVEPLLQMLNDPSVQVREACRRCLPCMVTVIPRETIMGLLRNERSLERELAVTLVSEGKIGLQTTEENTSFYAAAQQWPKLEKMGLDGTTALRTALDFQDSESRIEAVNALSRIGGRDALGHLYYALKDKDLQVRDAACKGLQRATGQNLNTIEQWLAYFQEMPESK